MNWYRVYYDWREDRIVNSFKVRLPERWGICKEPFPLFYFFTNCNEDEDMLDEGRYQWQQFITKEYGLNDWINKREG